VNEPNSINYRYEQEYNAKSDDYNLSSLSVIYRPSFIFDGISLGEIRVMNGFVSYYYVNSDEIVTTTFTWYRTQSPERHMNELFGRGAISEREIEYNGTNYVFLEWLDPERGESDGYSVFWVVDGRCYKAAIPTGFTYEEMLAFCQFEVVVVE